MDEDAAVEAILILEGVVELLENASSPSGQAEFQAEQVRDAVRALEPHVEPERLDNARKYAGSEWYVDLRFALRDGFQDPQQ